MRIQTYHQTETAFQGCRVSFKAVITQFTFKFKFTFKFTYLQIIGAGLWKSQSLVDTK